MIKKRYIVKKQDVCFYVFWILIMVGKGMGFTSDFKEFRYMALCALPFAFLKIILTRWTKKEILWSLFVGIIGVNVWLHSGEADILLTIASIIACKDIDPYKILRVSFWTRAVLYISRTSLAILGIIDIQKVTNTRGTNDIRYALGYIHPNTAHYELFLITVLILLLWHRKMRLGHYLLISGYNLCIYHYTLSRTGVLMTFGVLILAYLADRKSGAFLRKLIKRFGEYAYIFIFAFSVIMCWLQDKLPVLRLLGTFSSRFYTGWQVMKNMPLSLFGMRGINTDLGIIFVLYGRGILIFLLLIGSMTLLLKIFRKNEMYVEEAVGISYAIYTIMESSVASVLLNITLIFLAWIIYPNSRPNDVQPYKGNQLKRSKQL